MPERKLGQISDPTTQPRGLTSAEAGAKLERNGPNVLPPRRPLPVWRQIVIQFFHFFAIMLWIAGGLAILAGMSQLGIAIFVVIIINGMFAFVQEHRAEKASEKLRELLPRRVLVMRDGKPLEIDAGALVVDDVVLLKTGDRISADLTLLEAHALAVDTSTLTGETIPAIPGAGERVFAGTFVVEGEGIGLVIATGMSTQLAAIARLTETARRPESPLAQELDHVVRIIAMFALVIGLVFLTIALLIGITFTSGLLFAIGVMVALVPEGLLPTVTLSLAIGAQRMAARHALVRRLDAVETLGSTTFICTDKTGTLTLNQMSVVEVWTPFGSAKIEGTGYEPHGKIHTELAVLPYVRNLALGAARCSNGRAVLHDGRWTAQGDPLEAAFDVLARRVGIELPAEERDHPTTRRFPFDTRRRRMSVVAGDRLFVKGGTEAIFPCCHALDETDAAAAVTRMARQGLRVIAVASFVQAHDQEYAAFEAFAALYPKTTLLVDTYDTLEGVRKVIHLSRKLGERFRVQAVRLDSGDLGSLARETRKLLDAAGLQNVRIFASSGLDEHKIEALVNSAAPIDGFGVGTKLAVMADAPELDMAYKLVEYGGKGRLKLSTKKLLYPGRKQVFRQIENGLMVRDVIGRFDEQLPGEPLLQPLIQKSQRPKPTDLAESRRRLQRELARLPRQLHALESAQVPYPVSFSDRLQSDLDTLRRKLGLADTGVHLS